MNDRKLFIDVAKGMTLLLLVLVACGKTMGGGAVGRGTRSRSTMEGGED